jgi:hypothetical protein
MRVVDEIGNNELYCIIDDGAVASIPNNSEAVDPLRAGQILLTISDDTLDVKWKVCLSESCLISVFKNSLVKL